MPPGHVDELLNVRDEFRPWNLDKTIVHVIDREADSVRHYRQWQSRGHSFVVRADQDQLVMCNGVEQSLKDVVTSLSLKWEDVLNANGEQEVVQIQAGVSRIRLAETEVVRHRSANKNTEE